MYNSLEELPLIMNAKNVAEFLGISPSLSYKLFNRRDFPSVCIGRRKIVSRDKLVEWLDQQAKGDCMNV